eukprot:27052-Eustigmatos_ZCMA.PRE.1
MKSGKSSLAVRVIASYPKGFWTHKYIIAPTAHSQKHYWDFIGVPPERIFTVTSLPSLKAAMKSI